MSRQFRATLTLLFVLAPWELVRAASGTGAPTPSPPADFRPVVDKYCVTCHNDRLKTGGIELDTADLTNVAASSDI